MAWIDRGADPERAERCGILQRSGVEERASSRSTRSSRLTVTVQTAFPGHILDCAPGPSACQQIANAQFRCCHKVHIISGSRRMLSPRDASSPFQPGARKSFTRSEVLCEASNRSVHDQVSRSGWVSRAKCHSDEIFSSGAELRRILRRIVRRKGSKSSSLLLRTPLITLILHASRLPS
jgi:hypothetical protein